LPPAFFVEVPVVPRGGLLVAVLVAASSTGGDAGVSGAGTAATGALVDAGALWMTASA
jgi:hypothetical protein